MAAGVWVAETTQVSGQPPESAGTSSAFKIRTGYTAVTHRWTTREYTSPNIVFPTRCSTRRRTIGLWSRASRVVAHETLEIDSAGRVCGETCATIHRRTILDPLRVAEILIVLLLNSVTQLLDHVHEPFELGDSQHCIVRMSMRAQKWDKQ